MLILIHAHFILLAVIKMISFSSIIDENKAMTKYRDADHLPEYIVIISR